MTETTVAMQQEIFDQPLDARQLQAINTLVEQHKGNAAVTQQLALDASRLIASSQERLAKQAGSGFFKRFASKVSGKNAENQLQNQVDMLQIQRCAWHYLKQLQQQNLINAQAISVIRNNLGAMNDVIIETRDFLEEAIDRINRRLERVEHSASFNHWLLHIEANKRRFKSIPANLLVLRLTYDFMQSHPGVALVPRDTNFLLVTLEKLDVNCDAEIQLLDFIGELIEQIGIVGIERYREMIELKFEGHVIAADFVQSNVSGIGFNALYFLSEQYEKILDLTEDTELCRSDADRERIIAKLFGAEFDGLSTVCSVRDLIGEVIGGSALAIDIYKEVHGLNVVPEEPAAGLQSELEPEAVSLVSSLPDLNAHTFLDSAKTEQDRRNYMWLFALCIDSSTAQSRAGQEFLAKLAERACCAEVQQEISRMAESQDKFAQLTPIMQALLDDSDKVYAWLLDAFFLLALCQKRIESPQMLRVIGVLKPVGFKEQLPRLLALVNEMAEAPVLDAVIHLNAQTRGWKNVVQYRVLRFNNSFTDIEGKLNTALGVAHSLFVNLMDVNVQASRYMYFFGSFDDEGFFGKLGSAVGGSAFSLGRGSSLSNLNEVREKTRKLISEHSFALGSANRVMAQLNVPRIEFNGEISHSKFDLDNSASNENWHDQFSHAERQVNDVLMAFTSDYSDAIAQLGYFKAGAFDRSVIEERDRKREALVLQQEQEKLAKQSVLIEKDGRPRSFRIDWKKVERPPCDPDAVTHIKTDGKAWLMVDNNGAIYRSEDGLKWLGVSPWPVEEYVHVSKLSIVNGVWLLWTNREKGFFYSIDGLSWKCADCPELPSYGYGKTEDVVYLNGLWLWRFTERTEYSYTEKGVFFDSTKTSSFDKPIFYSAHQLGAQWERWEQTPQLPEGMVVESVHSLPGTSCLLLFCEFDFSYTRYKKKNDAASVVKYYIPGKDWRNCTWGGKKESHADVLVTRMGDKLMYFRSSEFLTSDKGYEWTWQPHDIYLTDVFHLKEISIFSSNRDDQIYLTTDGKSFSEFMLEEGNWYRLCANNQGLMAVFAPNSHETFLQIGEIVWSAVA